MSGGDLLPTPLLQLHTLYVHDKRGRIVSTREPIPTRGPFFALIRGAATCAWAINAGVPDNIATEVALLAEQEPPVEGLRQPPIHTRRYLALFGENSYFGPAFTFPDRIDRPSGIVFIDDVGVLERHFRGWVSEEISERLPILAVIEDGHAVSICFSSRRSPVAAEAGLETAPSHRGRGFGPRVTAAWANAVREAGLIPFYSTEWSNHASLAVARKLALIPYASDWSISGQP